MHKKQHSFLRFFLVILFFIASSGACSFVLADEDSHSAVDIAAIRSSANAGDADAEFRLAEAYRMGNGVAQSDKDAFEWYQKAANQNKAEAQIALGFIYRGGSGVAMDKILSYMWFDLAANNGNDSAYNLRNDVASSMTEEQVYEARKRVKSWRPEKPE